MSEILLTCSTFMPQPAHLHLWPPRARARLRGAGCTCIQSVSIEYYLVTLSNTTVSTICGLGGAQVRVPLISVAAELLHSVSGSTGTEEGRGSRSWSAMSRVTSQLQHVATVSTN